MSAYAVVLGRRPLGGRTGQRCSLALDSGEEQARGPEACLYPECWGAGSLSPLRVLRPQSSQAREETSSGVLVTVEEEQRVFLTARWE